MKRTAVVLCVGLALAAASGVQAEIGYGPVVLDDATVLQAGSYEMGLSAAYFDVEADVFEADITLDYGATDRVEIGARLPWQKYENAVSVDGLDDLVLDGKFSLMAETALL